MQLNDSVEIHHSEETSSSCIIMAIMNKDGGIPKLESKFIILKRHQEVVLLWPS